MSVVEVKNLRVELTRNGADIVDGISFSVEAGEIVGLVGESGSGKTTIGTAMLAYVRRGGRITGGEIRVDGADILALSASELSRVRGRLVSYVPQDPASGLNPGRRIGRQLTEALIVHESHLSKDEELARTRQALTEVKLPTDDEFMARYPHQVSGGQQQRVLIAMAFICRPKVIVLDEPTTGLDVTTQEHVLATVKELCSAHRVAALYVSHDLAVVNSIADRVIVLYAGRVVETGTCEALFSHPGHPYSRGLLAAIPDVAARRLVLPIPGHAPAPGARTPGCSFAPRCRYSIDDCSNADVPVPQVEIAVSGQVVRCHRAEDVFAQPMEWPALTTVPLANKDQASVLAIRSLSVHYGRSCVLDDVSLELRPRECLALVGESGSGKTTLSRAVMGLVKPSAGEIIFANEVLPKRARERSQDVLRQIQYVFQNPYQSLNPRRTVGQSIGAAIKHFYGVSGRAVDEMVEQALAKVSLPASTAVRFPRQLSGGERQRAVIARALVCEPQILICDEVTSALDVSVQAAIIQLLRDLMEQHELSMLFVTHNLAIVRAIADRVVVMHNGQLVEQGPVDTVLDHPEQDYTQALMASSPSLAGQSQATA